MWGLVLAVHIILCVFIVLIILLQSGKGTDMGAAFGGSSQTVFGPSGGATFLSKLTTVIAVGFLVTSLLLAYLSTKRRESTLVKDKSKIEETVKKETKTKTEAGTKSKSVKEATDKATTSEKPAKSDTKSTKEPKKK